MIDIYTSTSSFVEVLVLVLWVFSIMLNLFYCCFLFLQSLHFGSGFIYDKMYKFFLKPGHLLTWCLYPKDLHWIILVFDLSDPTFGINSLELNCLLALCNSWLLPVLIPMTVAGLRFYHFKMVYNSFGFLERWFLFV